MKVSKPPSHQIIKLNVKTSMRILVLTAISVASFGICASPNKKTEKDIELVISSDLETSIRSHNLTRSTSDVIINLGQVFSIKNKGDFGKIHLIDQSVAFDWTGDGLLAAVMTGSARVGANSGMAKVKSLCGLVTLLSESSSDAAQNTSSAVQAGNGALFFGFSLNTKSSYKARVVNFSTNSENICSPKASESFTFQALREENRRTEVNRIFSSKFEEINLQATCSVGQASLPASGIHASIRGEYLPVTCVYTENGKQNRTEDLAFLVSSGIYIAINSKTKYQTNAIRYEAVEYKE